MAKRIDKGILHLCGELRLKCCEQDAMVFFPTNICNFSLVLCLMTWAPLNILLLHFVGTAEVLNYCVGKCCYIDDILKFLLCCEVPCGSFCIFIFGAMGMSVYGLKETSRDEEEPSKQAKLSAAAKLQCFDTVGGQDLVAAQIGNG